MRERSTKHGPSESHCRDRSKSRSAEVKKSGATNMAKRTR